MKNVRVIARLDVKGPNVVKGVQFEALRIMGKPGEMAKEYFLQGADELLYLDIVASLYRRDNLLHIVREASKSIFIPFTAGGGVRSLEDIHELLLAGAEKVAINTAATKRPELIKEAAQRFGSQCVVVSIEAERTKQSGWQIFTDNGRQATGLDVVEWAKHAEELGAGEILLTSVEREGTERGLDKDLISVVTKAVSIPVIVSGGAASPEEIGKDISENGADAVAIASLLHYGKTNISAIKDALAAKGLSVRTPTEEERAQVPARKDETNVFDVNRYTKKQFAETVSIDPHKGERFEAEDGDPKTADVTIIDYGVNNVRSVAMAFESVGKIAALARSPEDILNARRLLLPGVGAFGDGMEALKEHGFVEPIRENVKTGTPLLGICLGMQLLFNESEEFGRHEGLGVIPGRVVSFPDPKQVSIPDYKLPNIGWRTIAPSGVSVYFVHSYYPVPEDPSCVEESGEYGGVTYPAIVRYKNVWGMQFHPEKSAKTGLSLLKRFCDEARA